MQKSVLLCKFAVLRLIMWSLLCFCVKYLSFPPSQSLCKCKFSCCQLFGGFVNYIHFFDGRKRKKVSISNYLSTLCVLVGAEGFEPPTLCL